MRLPRILSCAQRLGAHDGIRGTGIIQVMAQARKRNKIHHPPSAGGTEARRKVLSPGPPPEYRCADFLQGDMSRE